MLHTVNKSPYEKDSLQTCLDYAVEGSSILLIEDGVYAVIKGTAIAEKISASQCKLYALEPDLKTRGIETDKIMDGVQLVGYDGFADLVAENDKVQSWL